MTGGTGPAAMRSSRRRRCCGSWCEPGTTACRRGKTWPRSATRVSQFGGLAYSYPMPLTRRFRIGSLVCHSIEAGLQRLDGGAMFGVVPKPLWERRIPADARNRIPLQMRCLLVEHADGLVLIDTGAGNKDDAKFRDIYGLENAGDPGPTALEDGIREAGHDPADVKWVINTHLHFDHAGGNTVRRPDGSIGLGFPGATYVVQKGE